MRVQDQCGSKIRSRREGASDTNIQGTKNSYPSKINYILLLFDFYELFLLRTEENLIMKDKSSWEYHKYFSFICLFWRLVGS